MRSTRQQRAGWLAASLAMYLAMSAALVSVSGCGRPRRPDVVLIVVDTLRRDAVGVYGSTRPTTPAIDAFARSATRFERAYATAPWTQPSVASILTGLTPTEHGLVTFGSLPADVDPITIPLRAAGYRTAAVVSHILLARIHDFDRGFDDFAVASAYPVHSAVSSARVTDWALEKLARLDEADDPWLLLVHYFDPHYQYRRHPEHGYAPERAGRLDGSESIEDLRTLMADASPEEIALVRALYDEEVRFTDGELGRLLGAIDARPQDRPALLILASDHGEAFMEHGWLGHTRTLHEEVIRVPLIVRLPDGAGAGSVVDAPVSLAQIAATIADVTGVAPLPGEAQAVSLVPLIDADRAADASDRTVLVEVDFSSEGAANAAKTTHRKALVGERFKLLRDDETGAHALYDLASDPGELHDIAAEMPERVSALRAELEARLARATERRARRAQQ